MPTRLIPQPEHIRDVIVQPYADQDIPHSSPHWALQRKARNEHDFAMRDKHLLKDGFAGFYSATEPVLKIGDTVRRHLTRSNGKETEWRPSCRPIDPLVTQPRAYGKKAVPPFNAHRYEEVDDVPRGKKRVEPPVDQLALELPMFQLKHTVRDATTGTRVADRMSDMQASEAPRGPRLVPPERRRNELPQTTKGDKPYAAVELSSEYLSANNPMRSRMVPDSSTKLPRGLDSWTKGEAKRERVSDIALVRSLPPY